MKKIKNLILQQLTQGVTPRGLALTCAFGFILGAFPILGTTTLLCFLVATALKLNQPLIQALNYLLYPVHLVLIPIFLRLGERITQSPEVAFRPDSMWAQFQADWRVFLESYGVAALHAILAWAIFAPFAGALIYFVLRPVFEKVKKRTGPQGLP